MTLKELRHRGDSINGIPCLMSTPSAVEPFIAGRCGTRGARITMKLPITMRPLIIKVCITKRIENNVI